ncbi:unnamed protein product [Adineta ricciae]|uniref:Uncharacterized protein n=1 Tax=Adineta ricciae TaxID=249248 RepID=A0A814JSB8_ADIRI|nr:unnamed protein product [Adineta ricciae]CAF1041507.1 unnamed protein product [Adineta ricciae]
MANTLSWILISLTIFITGPIRNVSYPYSTDLSISGYIVFITGFIDASLYGLSFYSSIHKKIDPRKHGDEEKQFLQPIHQTLEILLRTQTELVDLIKDITENNTTDEILQENTRNKLKTLEFVQKDGLIEITKRINERLDTIQSNSFSNFNLLDRIHYYLYTSSFLLYIHQFLLWIVQYLSYPNATKYQTCSFLLSLVILCQALGFIYFIHLTQIWSHRTPLYLYTYMFFIRSLISIYHYSFYT